MPDWAEGKFYSFKIQGTTNGQYMQLYFEKIVDSP